MKKWLLLILLIVLPINLAQAYDLNLSIEHPNIINVSIATNYKFIITNLNGTASEYINFSLKYWILNNTVILDDYPKFKVEDLKSSQTINRQWTPNQIGNFSICGNITNSTANDTNLQNNYLCKNVYVQPIHENNTNITNNCDLSISVNLTNIIFGIGDEINYKLKVKDLNCQDTEHDYSIRYWIKDLFSRYLKDPYTSTYDIVCSDTSSHQKKAPEICGSEVYYIETQITEHGCNDSVSSNDFAQQMIIIKGLSPESSSCKTNNDESTEEQTSGTMSTDLAIDILEILTNATQGQVITTKINITNNYPFIKTIQVYSYIYEGQKLITEGGWTANRQEFILDADATQTIELKNAIKQDAPIGTYNFRIRAKVDEKNIDKTQSIKILEAETISNVSVHVSNETSEKIHKEAVIYEPKEGELISGAVIWSSELNRNTNISMLVFIAALLILTIALIISSRKR